MTFDDLMSGFRSRMDRLWEGRKREMDPDEPREEYARGYWAGAEDASEALTEALAEAGEETPEPSIH